MQPALPEKFLLSQKNLRDGEDLAGYDETPAAQRAVAIALEHKGKRGHTLMSAGPKGEKGQKATVVDASIFCAIALKARNGPRSVAVRRPCAGQAGFV